MSKQKKTANSVDNQKKKKNVRAILSISGKRIKRINDRGRYALKRYLPLILFELIS